MRREGHIPFPYQIILPSASENDLTMFKRECVLFLEGKTIFADKIYRDTNYWQTGNETKSNNLLTPIKAVNRATEEVKKRNKAADDFFHLLFPLKESVYRHSSVGFNI